jgi:hypothetical protein
MSHRVKTRPLCIYWFLKFFAEPNGSIVGLRPPNPHQPTACGHPNTPSGEALAHKASGGYAAEMGLPRIKVQGSTRSGYVEKM